MNSDYASQKQENKPAATANSLPKQLKKSSSLYLTDNRTSSTTQLKQQEQSQEISTPDTLNFGCEPIQRNKTGLPLPLKTGIEKLSGLAMDDVKVHYNSDQPAQLQAHAYAQGTNIHLAPGQEKHLPHEAWHVVQQKQGRVKPTAQLKGKVYLNNDHGLEREADLMGAKAVQLQSLAKHLPIPSLIQSISSSNKPIQRVWRDGRKHGEVYWHPDLDGVRWYADAEGNMWFEIDKEDRPTLEKYGALQGETHKKSWVSWNAISMHPSPEFTKDLRAEHEVIEGDDAEWGKWDSYMDMTIGSAKAADHLANVHKTEGFDPSTHDALAKSGHAPLLTDYVDRFIIVPKHEFNLKLWQIAENLAKIGPYTCIVSEPGKSNFWITARVLHKVKQLGGQAPRRIISIPTQEKGIKDAITSGSLNLNLSGAGTIVFLDDGSFSGSQLAKLINKVMSGARNPSRIGLVAESEQARSKIAHKDGARGYLATPFPIERHTGPMDEVHKAASLGINLNQTSGASTEGNHLLGFYYKVPDFASVRNKALTHFRDGAKRTAISGYSEARLDTVDKKPPFKMLPATEPYKVLFETPVHAYGRHLEDPAPVLRGPVRSGPFSSSPMGMGGMPVMGGSTDLMSRMGGMGGMGSVRRSGLSSSLSRTMMTSALATAKKDDGKEKLEVKKQAAPKKEEGGSDDEL